MTRRLLLNPRLPIRHRLPPRYQLRCRLQYPQLFRRLYRLQSPQPCPQLRLGKLIMLLTEPLCRPAFQRRNPPQPPPLYPRQSPHRTVPGPVPRSRHPSRNRRWSMDLPVLQSLPETTFRMLPIPLPPDAQQSPQPQTNPAPGISTAGPSFRSVSPGGVFG